MPHRVLVVDDEEGVRTLIRDTLVRRGLEVHLAAHGEEGIELFGSVAPHLVILDFLVPRKNGFAIAEAIRGHESGGHVPIVMMSGVFKNPKTAVEAREKYDVVEFLSKPLDLERLETLVSSALEGVPEGPGPTSGSEAPTPAPELVETPRRGPSRGAPRPEARAATSAARPPRAPRPAASEEPIVDGVYQLRPFPEIDEAGSLAASPVAQILSALLYEEATGMLDLKGEGGAQHRRVYVIDGRPTFMQSNAEGENVGTLLLRRGRITEQDFQRCRRYMKERQRSLQQSLLELKLVNESELATAYKLLAGQLLPVGVGMAAGRYQWQPGDAFVGRVPEGRFDPLQVIFQGVAKNVHPPRIFSFFSGREDVPIYPTTLWPERESAYRRAFPSAAALLTRIDGSQTFRTLTRARDLDASSALPQLFGLVTGGMAVLFDDGDQGLEAAVHQAAADVGYGDDSGPLELGFEDGPAQGASPEDRRARAKVEQFYEDVMSRNFFEIFNVEEDADVDAIKASYFELARKWHVDAFSGRNLGNAKPKLDDIFDRITEAYETITERREEYKIYLDRKRKGLPTDVDEILRGEQLYDQAAAMMRRRDWSGAREVLEEAARLNPDPIYFATLGWVVYNESPDDPRALATAVRHLKRGVSEQENLPIAYQYLGAIAFRRGQHGEASKWWKRCLEWEPNNADASRGLRMIAQRSGGGDRGKSILGRFRGKK